MTLKEVIEYVSDIKPNAFSEETLTKWINECEGDVQTEILCIAPEDIVTYKYSDNADTELIVGAPHDKIYGLYLLAMIDFSHGEYSKYENTMQLFNAARSEFAKWFIRTHKREVEDARGYYISAYGLAKKHGFVGTEEEWIKSLKGEQGPRGEKGDPGRDGWSPVVVFEEIDTGCKMIVQDYTGTKSVEIMDGKTPQKGEDYFTPEEVEDVKQHILDNTGISGKEDKANKVLSLDEDFMDQTFDDEKYPSVNAVKTVFGTVLSETSKAVSDGTNYAIEESKAYTNNEIAKFDFIKIEEQLPEEGLPNRIYLVPKTDTQEKDLFDEYLWVDNKWEWISTKSIEVDLTELEGKEDKSNKVSSTKDEYWWDYYNDVEGYPNMSTVSNGMIHMQLNKINPLSEQVTTLAKSIEDLKESGGSFTIDDVVDFGSQNSSNAVSGKAVYPIWYDVETLKYDITELEPIVKQANIARAFESYGKLIDFYDNLSDPGFINETSAGAASMGYYTPIGSSMYIQTLDVPDLWVKDRITQFAYENPTPFCNDIKADAQAAGMTLDEYIVHKINTEGEFSIKWLKFAPLETQKVDLANYYDKEEVDDMFADIGGDTSTRKEWELAASYVHSGNRKIQPTALDKTTGYFTCENHGLVNGDYIIPSYKVEDQVYCPIPFELLLKANHLNDTLYPIRNAVTVIDDNTFMITGKTSYAETNNTYVDVTKFYFETQNEDFSGFNNLDIDLNTHDVKIIAHDFGKRVNIILNNKGYIYRWLAMNNGHEFGLAQGIPITSLGGVESYGSVVLSLKNGILYGESQQSMYPIVLKSNTLENSRSPRNHQYYCPVLKEGNNLTTLNKIAFNVYYDKDIKPKNGGWIEIWKKKK